MAEAKKKNSESTFKRSRDRCHIINMMWVYDKDLNVLCNSFRYSAGEKYEIDALEPRHITHVLTGYYVRRAMNIFVGESGSSMVRLPVSKDFTRLMQFVNMQRFILCIPRIREVLPSSLVALTQLNHSHMRLAIDVYTLIYTRWAQLVKKFNYLLVNMAEDVGEQMDMVDNVKKIVPEIQVIARCRDLNDVRDAFDCGIDYVCCHDFPPELLLKKVERKFTAQNPTLFSDVCSILLAQFSATQNPVVFETFMRRYTWLTPYLPAVLSTVAAMDPNADPKKDFLTYAQGSAMMPVDLVHVMETILCLRLLSMRFESAEDRREGRITYMPFKMALEEGFIWMHMVKDPEISGMLPLFTLGCLHGLTRFVAAAPELQESAYVELMKQFSKALDAHPQLSNLAQAYDALQRTDLEKVQKIGKSDGSFTGATLSSAFEKSLIWVEALIKEMKSADPGGQ